MNLQANRFELNNVCRFLQLTSPSSLIIMSAPFSPMMRAVLFVLAATFSGAIETSMSSVSAL